MCVCGAATTRLAFPALLTCHFSTQVEKHRESVCVREREKGRVCACVCERESREKERECVRGAAARTN